MGEGGVGGASSTQGYDLFISIFYLANQTLYKSFPPSFNTINPRSNLEEEGGGGSFIYLGLWVSYLYILSCQSNLVQILPSQF